MKITGLVVENFKNIRVVEVNPEGAIVEITGDNGAGKSSLLDAIWAAIANADHAVAEPVRRGEDVAVIRVDFGEIRVTRKFRAKEGGGHTTTIVVEDADGKKSTSPQTLLNSFYNALTIDPVRFMGMKPEEQFDTLRALVPDVDFDAIDEADEKDRDERTEINRDAKALQAQADGITVPADAPTETIDEAALVQQLQQAGEHNADIERRKANRDNAARDIAAKRATKEERFAEAARLRALADAAEAEGLQADKDADELQSRLDAAPALPEPINTVDLTAKIAAARATNALVDARKRKTELVAKAREKERASEQLTTRIEKRAKDTRAAIAAAKIPVEGIGFGVKCVTLNGFPFDQASSAQKLRASIGIACALNPKLRTIIIKDGALIGSANWQIMREFAEQNDLQIFVETVESDRPGAVVIEDGMVKAAAQAVAAE